MATQQFGSRRASESLSALAKYLDKVDAERRVVLTKMARVVQEMAGESAPTRRGRPPSAVSDGGMGSSGRKRKRRSKMSAAQRKAVGARMKKYWAERRKAANR